MITRIDEKGIHYRFFPFHRKEKIILWTEIQIAQVRKYDAISEYGGWGLKGGFGKKYGTAINTKGNIGIQLVLTNSKKLEKVTLFCVYSSYSELFTMSQTELALEPSYACAPLENSKAKRKTLIIVPGAVIHQWVNTIEAILPDINIYEYIDDLFNLEQILEKKDDLIIIIKDEPNEPLIKELKNIWEKEGILITVFNIERLQFNILDNEMVPPHRILSSQDANDIRTKYNITNDSQFPDISRFSPVAMAISMRPGELCEITRSSKTAINSKFYRICSS